MPSVSVYCLSLFVMHAVIIVESGVVIMIAITLAIIISLAYKSTVASFLFGRGAVPSGECKYSRGRKQD